MTGRIRPRARLRELHLARDLDVSQSTIREALFQLEHAGLVVRIPNSGTTVASFSQDELRERIEVRLILEEVAFVKASRNVSQKLIEDLEQMLSGSLRANGEFAHSQAELAFHRRVWEQADNPTLYRTLEQLTAPLFAFAGLVAVREKRELGDFVTNHQVLIDALRRKDPTEIRNAIRGHIVGLQGGFFGLNGWPGESDNAGSQLEPLAARSTSTTRG
jgi:DNA-binding GntR family transcriptional regulator